MTIMSQTTQRTIFRWIHIVFAIPIVGYIYSPFDKLPSYAFRTRFIFVPVLALSGLWLWKGHVVRRIVSKMWPNRMSGRFRRNDDKRTAPSLPAEARTTT